MSRAWAGKYSKKPLDHEGLFLLIERKITRRAALNAGISI
jgi:hypothetical protein